MSKSTNTTNPADDGTMACCCGCGESTRRAFCPGHDNRFYGQVIRGERDAAELDRFPGLQRKWEARVKEQAAKLARKAAGEAEPKAAKVEPTPDPIFAEDAEGFAEPVGFEFTQVKDGRWWYPVKAVRTLDDGRFEVDWTAKNGGARTTRVGVDRLK